MAFPRIGSAGVGLPYPSVNSNLVSNIRTLAPGQKEIIPAGEYYINLGPYTIVQVKDPVSGAWSTFSLPVSGQLASDGVNFRLANLCGCVVGALVTTAGSGYLTPPTVTASQGNATFQSILGGRLNSTVTVSTTGVGYAHVPRIVLPPPPAGGVQATCIGVVNSSNQLTSVTMINNGAGYNVTPAAPSSTITALGGNTFGPSLNTYSIVPDPADTITTTAVLQFSIDYNTANNVSAVYVADPGENVTTVPSLTITAAPSGGTTAVATAIMLWTVTSISVSQAGNVYGNAQPFMVIGPGAFVSGTQAGTNPLIGAGLFQPTPFLGYGTSTAGGAVTTAGFQISYGGIHQAVPNLYTIGLFNQSVTGQAVVTANMGGVNDSSALARM